MQDVRCPCGKTVHYAPIPCGSRPPHCNFPCPKQPACGHPATPHECHWSGACPPCVILVEKPCVGGHVLLKAVACSKKEIECGRTCEKPMHCGLHT